MEPADSNPGLPSVETPETEQALHWLRTSHAQRDLIAAVSTKVQARRHRRNGLKVVGACFALLLIATVWLGKGGGAVFPSSIQGAATVTVTAPRVQVLPDGSVIELNESAVVSYVFSDERRTVTLVRGEAHFRVAKDPLRPFVVGAGRVSVRAVGTAFTVQLDSTGIEVLVTEGRVAVEKTQLAPAAVALGSGHSPTPEHRPWIPALDAGESVMILDVDAIPRVSALPAEELSKRLAWRVPQLDFSRTPLAEVVQLMNKHNSGGTVMRLDPTSRALDTIELSGLLSADNSSGLVGLLESNFGVEAERTGSEIILRKRR